MKYPNLFSSLKIGPLIAANRIEAAPMGTPNHTMEGLLTAESVAHCELLAKGGAGIVTLGESLVHPSGNSHGRLLPLYDPECLPSLIEALEAIKRHGAIASIQLIHAGMRSNPKFTPGGKVYGPDAIERYAYGCPVIKMDEETILTMVEAYGNAAEMVKFAGADMCMVHGGHGWLLAQFLSPYSNHRQDEFGGSLENRARFLLLVIANIRKKCGQDFPIELRISGDELMPGGMELAESIELAKLLDGKVEIIHVSATSFLSTEASLRMFPTVFSEHGCNVYLAEAIKKVLKKSLVCTLGALNDPNQMESIIAEKKADLVAIGRGLLADPYLPKKAKAGDEDITPCIRCTYCNSNNFVPYVKYATKVLRCSVNPEMGRELYVGIIPESKQKKKILIVGGGPAGMEAAITAADRGHEVTLCEKREALGGSLRFAVQPDFKKDLKQFTEVLIKRVKSRNIRVLLNTQATPELVKQISPDVIIAALGAEPLKPDIQGLDQRTVFFAGNLLDYNNMPGHRVVVIGGGTIGCEEGLALAKKGHEVVVVEMKDKAASNAPFIHWKALMKEIQNTSGIKLLLGNKCTKITNNGVFVEKDGKQELINADSILVAAGMKSNRMEAENLRFLAPEFRVIGDCSKPANVTEAMHDGYFTAMDF